MRERRGIYLICEFPGSAIDIDPAAAVCGGIGFTAEGVLITADTR